MGLHQMPEGQTAVITRICGGADCRSKLLSLGLIPGVPVKKIQHRPSGAVILEVLGTSLFLGQGMAQDVEVRL